MYSFNFNLISQPYNSWLIRSLKKLLSIKFEKNKQDFEIFYRKFTEYQGRHVE